MYPMPTESLKDRWLYQQVLYPVAPPSPLEAAALVFLAYVSRQAVKPRVLQTFTTAGAASLLPGRRLGGAVL